MSKRRIFAIIGLIFAAVGIICTAVSIFCQTENHAILNLGLASTFIAIILSFILNRKRGQQDETGGDSDQ